MTLDIIIVNYNSTDHLIRCLESVDKALVNIDAKIFVQDNASADNVDRIAELFPHVILQKNRENLGFAKGVNNALKQGISEFAVLLNPDTYVEEDFFDICLDFIRENKTVGIMGPRILDSDGRLQNSARSFPTPMTAFFGRTSFLSRRFPRNPITSRNLLSLQSDGKSPMEVDWVSGACMFVRRKAIESVGLLDERFFMYWEDADWCHCMKIAGWKVVYFPRASVYHYVGGSSEKVVFRSVVEFHKSVYRLFDKHLPSLSFLKPLVFLGLSMRLCFVLMSHVLHQIPCSLSGKAETERTESPRRDERIKILRIISRINIGGPAIHVHLLTTGLNGRKFQSKLVTGRISPNEGDMSYLFDSHGNRPIIIAELQREIDIVLDLKAFHRLFKLFRMEKPDIVDTHTAKAGTSARLAVFIHNLFGRRRIRSVHTFHGHVFEGYFSRTNSFLFATIERLLAMTTDAVIAISETQKQDLVRKYRIAGEEKVKTIELGFDLQPFFSCGRYRGQFREKLGIREDTLLIGVVGRLAPIKNHLMFLEAAKLFLEHNPGNKVLFVIVGDGELRPRLEARCGKLGISGHVTFCGWIKNAAYVYADLDVLALTSINEGTPVSIIESMAASVPVVATGAGGVRDLLGKSRLANEFAICERGLLCRKNEPGEFAKALKYFTEEDVSERNLRIARARAFVEKRYSHKRLFRDMEALYTELVDRNCRPDNRRNAR